MIEDNYIVVFPTEMEAERFKSFRPDVECYTLGVGVVESAAILAKILVRRAPRIVVLAGIAGAYSRNLAIGDVVEVKRETMCELPPKYVKSYDASFSFEVLPRVKSNTVSGPYAESNGAEIENLEGAGVFALCRQLGVKCCEVRSVSNYVGDRKEDWDMPRAIESLSDTLQQLL